MHVSGKWRITEIIRRGIIILTFQNISVYITISSYSGHGILYQFLHRDIAVLIMQSCNKLLNMIMDSKHIMIQLTMIQYTNCYLLIIIVNLTSIHIILWSSFILLTLSLLLSDHHQHHEWVSWHIKLTLANYRWL